MKIGQFWSHFSARRRKQLAWGAGIFLAYTLIGFLVVPQVIKWQMLKQLPGITKREASVRQVRVNPLTLSLTIRDLALKEPDGRVFASFEEFYINFQTSSLFRWAWTFKDIRLVRPYGEVILMEDGQLNFANMFVEEKQTKPEPPKEKGGIPRLNVFHMQLTNGFVAVQDRTRRTPFSTEYRPINFVLSDFSTRPDSDTPYSFRAESDAGRSVAWKGDFSVQPLKSSGSFELIGLRLNAYQPYVEDFTKAHLTNGIVDVSFSYRFEAGTNGIDLVVTNGSFVLDNLDIRDPQTSETVAGVGRVEIRGADLNLRERSVRLQDVHVGQASVQARIEKDGRLNLQELMVEQTSSSSSSGTPSAPAATNAALLPPWALAVDRVSVTNAGLVFEDFSRATPFKTEVRPIAFNLDGFNSRAGSNGVYNFQMVTESQERLAGSGSICVTPPNSRGEVTLTGLELTKYMPYAEDRFTGKVVAGQLNVQVPYRFALETNGIRAGVSNLAVVLRGLEVKAGEETIAQVGFAVNGVEASLEDKTAKIGVVTVEGSSVLVRREKDGSINLLKLIKSETSASTNT
ncbi:MAG TPA: DUF748 domain-containing protein, partial [Clostridia bacterium]|nr:DUF748 domain-containing protein [Clostridia bacterium]